MWLKCFTTVKPATLAAQPMSKSKSSMGLPALPKAYFLLCIHINAVGKGQNLYLFHEFIYHFQILFHIVTVECAIA